MKHQLFIIIFALFFFNSFQATSSDIELEDDINKSPKTNISPSMSKEELGELEEKKQVEVVSSNQLSEKSEESCESTENEEEGISDQEIPSESLNLNLLNEVLKNYKHRRSVSTPLNQLNRVLENHTHRSYFSMDYINNNPELMNNSSSRPLEKNEESSESTENSILNEEFGNYNYRPSFNMNYVSDELKNDPEFSNSKKCSDIFWFFNRFIKGTKYVFGVSAGITATFGEFWFVSPEASEALQIPTTALLWLTGIFDVFDKLTRLKATTNRKKAKKKIDTANYTANNLTRFSFEKDEEDSKKPIPYSFKNIPESLKNDPRFKYLRRWSSWYSKSSCLLGAGTCLSLVLAGGCSTLGLFEFGKPTTDAFRISTTLLVWFSGLLDRFENDANKKVIAARKEMQRMLDQENNWYNGIESGMALLNE